MAREGQQGDKDFPSNGESFVAFWCFAKLEVKLTICPPFLCYVGREGGFFMKLYIASQLENAAKVAR